MTVSSRDACIAERYTIISLRLAFHAVATLFLRDTMAEVEEGAGVDTVEVCVGITDVPSEGLQCSLTAFLSTTDETASKFVIPNL